MMDAHFWYGVTTGVLIAAVLFVLLEWLSRVSLTRGRQLPHTLREWDARKEQW